VICFIFVKLQQQWELSDKLSHWYVRFVKWILYPTLKNTTNKTNTQSKQTKQTKQTITTTLDRKIREQYAYNNNNKQAQQEP